MLAAAIVLVFLALLALSVAAPRIAMDLKRQREVEAQHRANQYVRALRVYYKKFNRYPSTVDQLEKQNNQRFLRQKYLDPLTGKDDWRLIHVGENKTKVKGFFGEDLPGIGGTGLGTTPGGSATTGTSGSGGTSAFGGTSTGFGGGASNSLGSSGSAAASSGTAGGTSGASPGATGATGSTGGSGIQSTNASDFNGSGGGLIMGIGSSKSGDSIITVNEQTTYQDWEFLYAPRLEQVYAKGTLLGGVNYCSGASTGRQTYARFKPTTGTGGINNPSGNPPTTGTTPVPGAPSPQ